MTVHKFAKRVTGIMPQIFVELARRLPKELTEGKVSFPQLVIMELVQKRGGTKMSDIACVLGITMSGVTGLVNRMIRFGFLERSRSLIDRRIVNVKITTHGANVTKKIERFRLKTVENLFSNVTQKEQACYLRILKKLQKNIEMKRGYKLT